DNETFYVNLSNPVNATIADNQGVGTIVDDDINLPPVADAGPDQNVLVGTVVNLDGSNSTDPDGHMPLIYNWQQTGGTAVVLSSTDISHPTFIAPATPTILTFTLVVTDALGLSSVADSVVITVSDEAVSGLSVVSSGSAMPGTSISFTATLTGGTNVTYQWDFGDGYILDNGPEVTHIYMAAGNYTVVVTATNSVNTLIATIEVDIADEAPLDNKIYLPLIMKAAPG
ncbi:MAG: PKD domain-containing protein, partial [Anaerolineae bacterium]|nr:PKD domain-containing protein [Anaerolineae bacterium]